jgi:anti-sigma B factor antagonist
VSFAEPQLRVREDHVDGRTTVVAVEGEIHVSTAPALRQLLSAATAGGPTALVLDLSAAEFIDSTDLSVLLNVLRDGHRAGGRLALACANPNVLRLFQITHLDETFDIHPDRAAALRAAQGETDRGAP